MTRRATHAHLACLALLAVAVPGCVRDAPEAERAPATDSGTRGTRRADAAGDPLRDGASAGRVPCPNPPIPEGDLQDRASGPSVFGSVVGGDPGWFDPFGSSECGLAGVRVCLRDAEICTQSDAAGQFVLDGLPEGTDLEVTFRKDGFLPVLRAVGLGFTPINLRATRILTEVGGTALLASTGMTPDADKGMLVGLPLAAGEGIGAFVLAEGVALTLEPGGMTAVYSVGAVGPDALSSDELDTSLRSSRFGGWGIFLNVGPGDYTVRFDRAGAACNVAIPGFGYGADRDGNIRVKVVAGYTTGSIAAFCP